MKPVYEEGRYACKVTKQALGEAKTGTPQFVLSFTVMGKVDPADTTRFIPAPQQYERTMFRAITEKTMPYFLEDLKSLGFSGDSFRQLDPETAGFHDFSGQDVDMWCSHEKDQQGDPCEKWGVARQAGSLEIKPLENKKVRELDNLFGKQLKGLAGDKKQQPPAASGPIPAYVGGDDDISF